MAGVVGVSFLTLALAGIYSVRQQNHINRELCQSTVDNRAADRVQWTTLRDLVLPTLPDRDSRLEFERLIAGVLQPIPPLECRDNKPVPKEG
jgi:hypothetical protein